MDVLDFLYKENAKPKDTLSFIMQEINQENVPRELLLSLMNFSIFNPNISLISNSQELYDIYNVLSELNNKEILMVFKPILNYWESDLIGLNESKQGYPETVASKIAKYTNEYSNVQYFIIFLNTFLYLRRVNFKLFKELDLLTILPHIENCLLLEVDEEDISEYRNCLDLSKGFYNLHLLRREFPKHYFETAKLMLNEYPKNLTIPHAHTYNVNYRFAHYLKNDLNILKELYGFIIVNYEKLKLGTNNDTQLNVCMGINEDNKYTLTFLDFCKVIRTTSVEFEQDFEISSQRTKDLLNHTLMPITTDDINRSNLDASTMATIPNFTIMRKKNIRVLISDLGERSMSNIFYLNNKLGKMVKDIKNKELKKTLSENELELVENTLREDVDYTDVAKELLQTRKHPILISALEKIPFNQELMLLILNNNDFTDLDKSNYFKSTCLSHYNTLTLYNELYLAIPQKLLERLFKDCVDEIELPIITYRNHKNERVEEPVYIQELYKLDKTFLKQFNLSEYTPRNRP